MESRTCTPTWNTHIFQSGPEADTRRVAGQMRAATGEVSCTGHASATLLFFTSTALPAHVIAIRTK